MLNKVAAVANFPAPNCDSDSPFLLGILPSSEPSFYFKLLSLHFEILIMLLGQFSLAFLQPQVRILLWFAQILIILLMIGMVFMIKQKMFQKHNILKLGLPAATFEFCNCVHVSIDAYVLIHLQGFQMLWLLS